MVKKVKSEDVFAWRFFTGTSHANNFHDFKELVFFDLWNPDSGFRIPVPNCSFPFPGFKVAQKGRRLKSLLRCCSLATLAPPQKKKYSYIGLTSPFSVARL